MIQAFSHAWACASSTSTRRSRRSPRAIPSSGRTGRPSSTRPAGSGSRSSRSTRASSYDLDHVAFRVRDPEETFAGLAQLGFDVEDGSLRAGDSRILLEHGDPGESERPLYNHLGLRVESADDHIEEAERRGIEIADVVDAANTYAVFVWGPERIKLEYVEHKPTFSLT